MFPMVDYQTDGLSITATATVSVSSTTSTAAATSDECSTKNTTGQSCNGKFLFGKLVN